MVDEEIELAQRGQKGWLSAAEHEHFKTLEANLDECRRLLGQRRLQEDTDGKPEDHRRRVRGSRALEAEMGSAPTGREVQVEEISRDELKEKMDRGEDFVLVEALSRRHYEPSHLPGAINLPYELVDEAGDVLPDRDAEIVVYCMNEGCESSKEEASDLEGMGYSSVLHYAGGKEGWIRAALPVEGKRPSG